MNTKTGTISASLDKVKLVFSLILFAAGIVAFYHFDTYSALLRVLSLLAIAGISTALAYNTELGRGVWALVYDSRMEVRKIVWPTQEETTQTTIVVFVMVIV
ncbi:preprotein translocase subunit SecE, partial [Achromatium sp. WMS2]